MRLRVLIVGGEPDLRQQLRGYFVTKGASVRDVVEAARAADLLPRYPADLVVVAGAAVHDEGGEFLRAVRAHGEAIAVVAVVDAPEPGRDALTNGAYDFFLAPVDFERMDAVLRRIGETVDLRERNDVLGQLIEGPVRLGDLVTQDPGMIRLFAAVRRLARGVMPVLLEGEPGTGKKSLARVLHEFGRRDGAFVVVAGRELSGEALQRAYVEARGGTVMVDDLAAVGPEVAVGIVALLDRRGADGRDAVRVITSRRETGARVARLGTVHEDLAARLAGTRLTVPPLRERPSDIPLIAQELLRRRTSEGTDAVRLSPGAEAALLAHPWKANVSELAQVLDAAATSAGTGSIALHHLPPLLARPAVGGDPGTGERRRLRDVEVQHLCSVLRETGGNKARAARILGVSRWALQRRMQKHGIRLEDVLAKTEPVSPPPNRG